MKTSALNDIHEQSGARMGEFAGWRLPIDYGSVISEVWAVRAAAGLFDVSHMGRLATTGGGVFAALQRLLTNDLSRLDDGGCQYTLMCRPDGGVIDDLIVCRESAQRYLAVVNASNHARDCSWISEHLPESVSMTDTTAQTSMLALQGPNSVRILAAAGMAEASEIGRFRLGAGRISHIEVMASRTGYTGEDGFEIMCDNSAAGDVWKALMSAGANYGLTRCGLAARDVLRIEAALPLYGHEIDEQTNPVEAGLTRFVKPENKEFVGREAIVEVMRRGARRKLVGVRMAGRAIPRSGAAVICEAGEGAVTSGTFSPTLGIGVAIAYMPPTAAAEAPVEVVVRGRAQPGSLCALPFYTRRRA